jgi:septum formation protein
MPSLLLASTSPRRRELLAGLGLTFRIEAPEGVTEWEATDADPAELVRHNAELKGRAVSGRFPSHPVLSADTTVSVDGHVLNKPTDLADARRMLRMLSGRPHEVFTGVGFFWPERGVAELLVERSFVVFKTLTENDISTYLSLVNVLDKAGAYGVQDHHGLIVDRFEGSFSNIMGLPVERVGELLRRHGLLG